MYRGIRKTGREGRQMKMARRRYGGWVNDSKLFNTLVRLLPVGGMPQRKINNQYIYNVTILGVTILQIHRLGQT